MPFSGPGRFQGELFRGSLVLSLAIVLPAACCDSAYEGQKEAITEQAPLAQDYTHAKGRRNHPLTEEDKSKNRTKSGVRAKVEHVFRVLKCQFGFTKVRYRGLEKNANHLFAALALVNIVMAKKKLLWLSQE
jgi:IS5 family transposase